MDISAKGDGLQPLMPLDVLLALMRQKWNNNEHAAAAEIAKHAAPYVHARPGSGAGVSSCSALDDANLADWLAKDPLDEL